MTQSAGYAVDQFRDRETEVERLKRQASFLAAQEDAALREAGLIDNGALLDIGCGPGFVAGRLAASRPGLVITGMDRDEGLVARASESIESVRFVHGLADALPFDDDQFDGALSRLVFRHLPDVSAALGEAARVLRPGGRLVLVDSDDDALLLHPTPHGFQEVLAARQETSRRRGANPCIGRELPALLRAAGFEDVRIHLVHISSVAIGPAAFAAIVLAPIADGVDADLVAPEQVEAAARALETWGRGDSFGLTTAFVVSGAEPSK